MDFQPFMVAPVFARATIRTAKLHPPWQRSATILRFAVALCRFVARLPVIAMIFNAERPCRRSLNFFCRLHWNRRPPGESGLTLPSSRWNLRDDAGVVNSWPKEDSMNRHLLGGVIAATVLWPALAAAQTTVIETTGSVPPDEVITYVQRERVPSIRVEGDVRAGFI